MENPKLILAGHDASELYGFEVGGKGLNLLRLYSIAQATKMFNVPDFFIIPGGYPCGSHTGIDDYLYFNDNEQVRTAFERMQKPVIARSSSPFEDGINASFAGMFSSFPDQNTYEQFVRALHKIEFSAFSENAKQYAERMGIDYEPLMAFIAQKQVTDFLEKGVIQLEENGATIEVTSRGDKKSSHDIEYELLSEMIPEDYVNTLTPLQPGIT